MAYWRVIDMSWSNEDSKNLNRIRRQTSKTPMLDSIIDIVGSMAKKENDQKLEAAYIKSKISSLNHNNEKYIKGIENGEKYEKALLDIRKKYRLPATYYLTDYTEKSDIKIYNSCKNFHYECSCKGEYFLAVFDNTLMGSADAGFILTSRRIIIKNQSSDAPRSIDLNKIDRMRAHNFDILLNDGELVISTVFFNTSDKIEQLFDVLRELKGLYSRYIGVKDKNEDGCGDNVCSSSGSNKAEMDKIISSLRKLKELVDEGIITEEEYVAKKRQMLGI